MMALYEHVAIKLAESVGWSNTRWQMASDRDREPYLHFAKIAVDTIDGELSRFLRRPKSMPKSEEQAPLTLDGADRRLKITLGELELSTRACNALGGPGATIGDILAKREAELLRTPNFGGRSLRELNEALQSIGLRLNTRILLPDRRANGDVGTPPQENAEGALTVSIAETVKATGLSRATIYNLIGKGELSVVKVGRRTLVKTASIRQLVDAA